MNLLFIHEISWYKVIFDWQTLPSLLAQRGHNVYIVDYEKEWKKEYPFDLISPKMEIKTQRIYSPITLIRPQFIKIPILSRVSAFISHYFAIEKTIKEKKIDAIILYSVPTNGLQTINLAHKYKIPVIFRSIDVLNQLVPKPLSWITKQMEKYVYRHTDMVLPINLGLLQYVVNMGAKKVETLPLGIDKQFKPMNTNGLRKEMGWDNYKIVLFVGTLPMFSGLDRVIKDFPRLLKEYPETKLFIAGDGKQRDKLENIIDELGLRDSIYISGYVKYEKIPEIINVADVCINPFDICKATQDIFPTKVIQYMSCGKQVVSTPLSGLDDCRAVIFNENIVDGLITYFKEKPQYDVLSYVKRHDYDVILNQLEGILNESRIIKSKT
jgi:glycosyltransferase involved in cell wall biosynthesis